VLLSLAAAAGAQDLLHAPGRGYDMESEVMGETRRVFVHLPPLYEANQQAYPVLYLTDARGSFAHTVTTADFLARQQRAPEMIVVGVTNTDRTRDLTPTNAKMTGNDGQVFEFPTAGGADRFLDFFEKELIPWVEKEYRTVPYRVFAGHSFGGLFALHALTDRSELFDALIATSPTFRWDDDLPLRRLRAALAGDDLAGKALFVSLGNEGEVNQQGYDAMHALLSESGVDDFRWGMQQWLDEDHGSVVMSSQYAGLRTVFDGWWFPRDPDTGRFSGGLDDLLEHYAGWSRRLGVDLVPPEVQLNNLGYQHLADGEVDLALRAFRLNVKNRPGSANVHDSLGEGLERKGRTTEAASHYRRAVKLAEKTGDNNLEIFRRHLERVEAAAGASAAGVAPRRDDPAALPTAPGQDRRPD
jgi:predicted alpha/beta superfamily hydrolase